MSVAPPFVGQQPQEFELQDCYFTPMTCGGYQKLRLHEDHMEMEQHQPCPWFLAFMGPPGPLIACAFANSKCTTRVPYHNITSVESDYCCCTKHLQVWYGGLWPHFSFGFLGCQELSCCEREKSDADVVAAAVMARVHALRVTQVAARAPQMMAPQPMMMMQQQQPMMVQQQK